MTCPGDPDIVTQADTVEEAFEMARDAISLFEEEDRAADMKAKQSPKKRGLVKKTG